MSQPDFDDYLDFICKDIKSRKMRDDIKDEILCHLEANYERNLATGMNEEEARADAVSKMGDSDTLSYRLSAIHSYSPLNAMSSAFIMLTVAYTAMNFFLSSSVKEILFLCGIPVMFSALLRMRKMNSETEKAFHLFNLFALSKLLLYCIGLGRILPLWVNGVGYFVIYISLGLFWFFLFTGLHKFCKPYITEDCKKPRLYAFGVYHALMSFFAGFMMILAEGEKIELSAFILPLFIIFMFFYGVVQLLRMRRILWDADGEYGILPDDGKHLKIFIATVAACVITVFGFNLLSSNQQPVKTELIIRDVSESEQKEADEVRQKMLDWGVHEQVTEDLPDSEILKYKDAVFMTWGADGGSMGDSLTGCIVNYYWFFFPDEEYPYDYEVRILWYIESDYGKAVKSLYRKGFYYAPWVNVIPLNRRDERNGSFIGIITDEGGKKYNAEPFFTYNMSDDEITCWPKGFEYREEKGQRVYYATDIGVQNLREASPTVNAVTVRKRWLCSFNYNTTADFAETLIEYGKVTSRDDKYMPFYWRTHGVWTESLDENAIEALIGKSKKTS